MQHISIKLAVSKLLPNRRIISHFVQVTSYVILLSLWCLTQRSLSFLVGQKNVAVSHMSDSFIFCFSKNQIKLN